MNIFRILLLLYNRLGYIEKGLNWQSWYSFSESSQNYKKIIVGIFLGVWLVLEVLYNIRIIWYVIKIQ